MGINVFERADRTVLLPISLMSENEALEKLAPLGKDVQAAFLRDPPWKHTGGAYGFIPIGSSTGTGKIGIQARRKADVRRMRRTYVR